MNDEFIFPLNWGLSEKDTKEFFLAHNISGTSEQGYVCIQNLGLSNFQGDCGSLLITDANSATSRNVALVIEYASLSGFDKLFATVCSSRIADAVGAFTSNGFKIVSSAPSNRNPTKTSVVLFYLISNPKHKGY
jgi:hypothetical protein